MQAVRERIRRERQGQAETDLARLIGLIEADRIEQARELAGRLAERWPDSAPIQHLRRVLEPPTARVSASPTRPGWAAERAWILAHADKYPGHWLALLGDRLVAHGTDRGEVIAAAETALGHSSILMFFQPADPG